MSRADSGSLVGHDGGANPDPSGAPLRRALIARILCVLGASALLVPEACSSGSPRSSSPGSPSSSSSSQAGSSGTGGAPASSSSRSSSSSSSSGHGGSASFSPDGGDGGPSGSGGAGGGGIAPTKLCIQWPFPIVPDGGDAGADAGDVIPVDAGPCPTDFTEVLDDFLSLNCPRGFEPAKIVSGPVMPETAGACCYETYLTVCGPGGRPFVEHDHVLLASGRASLRDPEAWKGGDLAAWPDVSNLSNLTMSVRQALADEWALDARREHASVPAFARIALSLLAVGAPAELVRRTHEAALDEVRHAELSFALASAYAGTSIAPGPFPLEPRVSVATSLAELTECAVLEGCVGETIAAAVAAEQLERATDPAVRTVLAIIAEDEARHAELAWRTVAWAVAEGGEVVREAAARAFHRALSALDTSEATALACASPGPDATMVRHGRLPRDVVAAVSREIAAGVLGPCAGALLGSSPLTMEGSRTAAAGQDGSLALGA